MKTLVIAYAFLVLSAVNKSLANGILVSSKNLNPLFLSSFLTLYKTQYIAATKWKKRKKWLLPKNI